MIKSVLSFQVVSLLLFSSLWAQKTFSFELNEQIIYDHALSSSGNTIAVGDGNVVKWFDRNSQQLLGSMNTSYDQTITAITLLSDSTFIITGYIDGMVKIYDIMNGSVAGSYHSHSAQITSLTIDEISRVLVSTSSEGRIIQFDLDKMVVQLETNLENSIITYGNLNSNSSFVFSTNKGEVGIQQIGANGIRIEDLETNWIRSISTINNGNLICVGGDNGRVQFLEVDTTGLKLIDKRTVSFTWLLALKLINDQPTFVIGDLAGQLKLYFPQGKYIYKIRVPINDIEYTVDSYGVFTFTIATRGKGLLLIDTKNMKYKGKKEKD